MIGCYILQVANMGVSIRIAAALLMAFAFASGDARSLDTAINGHGRAVLATPDSTTNVATGELDLCTNEVLNKFTLSITKYTGRAHFKSAIFCLFMVTQSRWSSCILILHKSMHQNSCFQLYCRRCWRHLGSSTRCRWCWQVQCLFHCHQWSRCRSEHLYPQHSRYQFGCQCTFSTTRWTLWEIILHIVLTYHATHQCTYDWLWLPVWVSNESACDLSSASVSSWYGGVYRWSRLCSSPLNTSSSTLNNSYLGSQPEGLKGHSVFVTDTRHCKRFKRGKFSSPKHVYCLSFRNT